MRTIETKSMAIGILLALCSLAGFGCNGDMPISEAVLSPDASRFDLTVAVEMSRLTLHAYQQLDDFRDDQPFRLPEPYTLIEEFFTRQRFAGERSFRLQDVPIAFIATSDAAIYVVFRGTETISEWIQDVIFAQVDYPFANDAGRTHKGATDVYATLHDALTARVAALDATGLYTTLYVTGHSLGGALAVLAAPALRQVTMLEPIVYTFAAPRVGDDAFTAFYLDAIATSHRIDNLNDLVPTLPPTTVFVLDGLRIVERTYRHVPYQTHIEFGASIDNPLDLFETDNNHDVCNYYSALCDFTLDPLACKALSGGADDCNP